MEESMDTNVDKSNVDQKYYVRKNKLQCRLSPGVGFGIIVTMLGSALPAGHNLGVINTPQQQIRQWIAVCLAEEYGVVLSTSQEYIIWGLAVSVYVGGALIGSTTGAHLANGLGRLNGLLLVHLVFLLSGCVIISCQFANILELLLIGRLIAGLASGAATSLVPLYLSEIAAPSWRGVMGTLFPLGMCAGILISQILGITTLASENSWAFLVGGHVFYVLLSLPFHKFLVQSPTHLYLNEKDPKEAHKVLWKLRNEDIFTIAQEENVLITACQEKEMKKIQGGSWKLFSDKRFYKSLIVVIVLNAGQQLSGINAVFFYSTLVFLNSGLEPTQSVAASLCAGIPNLIMAALALPLVRYVRRRSLLMVSISLYCFWQIILTLSLHYVKEYPWLSWVALVSIFALVLTYGIGLGPVPYMIGTEIFTSEVRGLGLAVGGMSNWGANLLVGLLFPVIHEQLNNLSFAVFICVCVMLLVFVYFQVPETYKRRNNNNESYVEFGKHSPGDSPITFNQNSPLLLFSKTSNELVT